MTTEHSAVGGSPTGSSASHTPASRHTVSSRNVTAVLGPTNTGKTHLAIERMLGHESGMIGLPLRLLAREVFDKVVDKVGADNVALITGEEKIKPGNPKYYICTVEAMPLDIEVAFLAIDEIQLAADAERGHVFTQRLFQARGTQETLLLGAATMLESIKALLPGANIVSRPRLSKLSYAGQKKLSRLPRRTAIVAFSANEVYEIAELIRRQRGGAAVVLGALSPRTRNAQVALYENGEVDFLVATDAIGMGLNLDVTHVAFAGARKFDGFSHRELLPAELGQIAGRAGRYMNDGTFGVTGNVEPFAQELVTRLEDHHFEPVRTLQWRNENLDFSTLAALKDSLMALPDTPDPHLVRSRITTDLAALENISRNTAVQAKAKGRTALKLLWDLCQLPDYRKISATSHADLIITLFGHLTSNEQCLPEPWFAEQVAFANRTDGDIDTIATRIAHIRTWTYIANRPDWLANPAAWQDKTREIENNLSDALHEALTNRFVDKRTSVLMRRLRDEDELFAEINDDGAIHVEDYFVGRLDGFNFTPDTTSGGVQAKAARGAAVKVLAQELSNRAGRLVSAPSHALSLSRTGILSWERHAVARLEPGENAINPELHLLADEHLQAADRDKVISHLGAWLKTHISTLLDPLVKLSAANDIEGLARGVAFQMTENLGSLNRLLVAEDIRQLDQPSRAQLRRYGIRFGAYNIFMPQLLKPAAAELITLLWALKFGEKHKILAVDLPEPPRAGLTSAPRDEKLAPGFYRAAGFHSCGTRVVRMDMLERLGDLIRPLLYWRHTDQNPTRPDGSVSGAGFRVQPDMLSILGCGPDEFSAVLKSLGYHLERRPVKQPPGRKPPTAVEREVTKIAVAQLAAFIGADPQQPAPGQPLSEDKAEAPAEIEMEDIWRLRPRRPANARDGQRKGRGPHAGQRSSQGTSTDKEEKTADGARNTRRNANHRKDGQRPGNKRFSGIAGDRKETRSGNKSTNKSGGYKGKPRGRRPDTRNSPAHRSAAPPKKAAGPDPDSPFAALTKLKKELETKPDKPAS